MDCPHPHDHNGFHKTLGIIGEKWTIELLHHIRLGKNRFGLLKKELPGISPKTLTERLRSLESESLVRRIVVSESPLHIEYELTAKGMSLGKVIAAMDRWPQS